MLERTLSAPRRRAHGQAGASLLLVLVVLFVISMSSTTFISFMNRQQSYAGLRYRSAAAMSIAESGVHQALAMIEQVSLDQGAPRTWPSREQAEVMEMGSLKGRRTVEIEAEREGTITVTSVGEIGGVKRGLRAIVHQASPALLAALYGTSSIRLGDPPAATWILPYQRAPVERPWIHVAAGREVWVTSASVSLNRPSSMAALTPGPVEFALAPVVEHAHRGPGSIRVLLSRGGNLLTGQNSQPVDAPQFKAMGVPLDAVITRDRFPEPPEIDRVHYRNRASANPSNADLNKAVGDRFGDTELAGQLGSLYTPAQFERLQLFTGALGRPLRLRGIVYVTGGVSLYGQSVRVDEGALITEGTVHIRERAALEIVHTTATRTLPGLVVLDNGSTLVTHGGGLRVHGLVYSNRVIDLREGAHADVVGAVVGNDPGLSFRNADASIVIRYDPAVLGTPGVRAPARSPVIAWVAAWEELPEWALP